MMPWLLMAAVAAAAPAEARSHLPPRPQDLVPPGQAAAYEAFYRQEVGAMTVRHVVGRCRELSVHTAGLAPLGSPALQGLAVPPGALESGLYKESWTISGCGPQAVQNMLVARKRGGGWLAKGIAPGATLASIALVRDAVPLAEAALARRPPPGCTAAQAGTRLQFVDTVVLARPARPGAPWTEQWRYSVCERPRTVLLRFQPSPRGGTDVGVVAQ